MIDNILLMGGLPGPIELLVVLIVSIVPVVLIIQFLRLFLRNKRENIRLRLEVGKLADELEQMRKNKDNNANKSSDVS